MEISGPIGTSVTYFALLFDEKSLPEKLRYPTCVNGKPGYVGQLGWAVEYPIYPGSTVLVIVII